MLCSSIITCPLYQPGLFDGSGLIPTVPSLQFWLEKAWNDGFDVEGALSLGGGVFDSKKLVGTTECVTILRSMRVRACFVDFSSPKIPEKQFEALLQQARSEANRLGKKNAKRVPNCFPNTEMIDACAAVCMKGGDVYRF